MISLVEILLQCAKFAKPLTVISEKKRSNAGTQNSIYVIYISYGKSNNKIKNIAVFQFQYLLSRSTSLSVVRMSSRQFSVFCIYLKKRNNFSGLFQVNNFKRKCAILRGRENLLAEVEKKPNRAFKRNCTLKLENLSPN